MVKVPEGIQTIPVGAQRSFDVPSGPVAQKPEEHSMFAVQEVPRGDCRTQLPALTQYPLTQALAVQLP